MSKLKGLALIYVTIILMISRSDGATTQDSKETADQMLERFLIGLTKQSNPNSPNKLDLSQLFPNPTQRPAPAARPVPVRLPLPPPPIAPSHAGPISFEAPVAWPYPPAPQSTGRSEFPLLDRFLSSNGITNYQPSNSHQNSLSPSPVQPVQTQSWKPIIPSNPLPKPMPFPLPSPQPQLSSPMMAMPSLPPPPSAPTRSWDYDQPAELRPNGQRYYNLDTVRMNNDHQGSNNDKLNVSFIMEQHLRPLSLNFDSGDIVVDFGQHQQQPQSQQQNTDKTQPEVSKPSKNLEYGYRLQSNPKNNGNRQQPQTYGEDQYVVLRHDANQYAYDLPNNPNKNDGSIASYNSGQQQSPSATNTDRYTVPANKENRFVLGRVSN